MKSKKALTMIVFVCVILISACNDLSSQEAQNTNTNGQSSIIQSPVVDEVNNQSHPTSTVNDSDSDSQSDNASMRLEGINLQGGYDVFDRRYIDVVENIYYGTKIVGEKASEQWKNDVYLKKSAEEQSELPSLYQMIRDLSIPKEDMIKLNLSLKDQGATAMVIPDHVIESLYVTDENNLKKSLVSPLALYSEGSIYTVNDLKKMSLGSDNVFPLESSDLKVFVDKIDELIRNNTSLAVYEAEYAETIRFLESVN